MAAPTVEGNYLPTGAIVTQSNWFAGPLATAIVIAAPGATAMGPTAPLTVGPGARTISGSAAEVPPPGAGVKTVILRVAAVARSLAGTVAVIDELETKVVGRAVKPLPPNSLNVTRGG